ncbi:disulfide formation protein [Halalkalicoccus paucihalophilus]|uniref:Disulfide formation protein n=1 Tax=Halalkalicoccus paucihalophilus TaxID=1008153 RepID=A0A151AIX9_9EURY|nr:disulfide bond formation protein B [Halalkalicoccus paucihalophilus]KYH27619.1 disulfide formation protein [Halalkalicoccus paucihalophilus]
MRRLGSREWLAIGTLVAAIATAGSLYFSEILGLVPCDLCWYQRVFMYPLVLVLGIAAFEDRPEIAPTALAFAIPGAMIAAYHSAIQRVGTGACTVGGGCTSIQYELLGLSIPNMALLAFVLVAITMFAAGRSPI